MIPNEIVVMAKIFRMSQHQTNMPTYVNGDILIVGRCSITRNGLAITSWYCRIDDLISKEYSTPDYAVEAIFALIDKISRIKKAFITTRSFNDGVAKDGAVKEAILEPPPERLTFSETKNGTCCICGYSGQDQVSCDSQLSETHCSHWKSRNAELS